MKPSFLATPFFVVGALFAGANHPAAPPRSPSPVLETVEASPLPVVIAEPEALVQPAPPVEPAPPVVVPVVTEEPKVQPVVEAPADEPFEDELGIVRPGPLEAGCFVSVEDYLDVWDKTGVAPDPCFVRPEPNNQDQSEVEAR